MKSNNLITLSPLFLLCLMMLAIACNTQKETKETESFLDKNFTPFEDVITVRGNPPAIERMQTAMNYYNQKNYPKAIQVFEDLSLDFPGNDSISFYLGISCLASQKTTEAATHLEDVLDAEGSIFRTPAKWFLALAKFDQKDYKTAAPLLKDLSSSNNSFQSRAKALLNELPEEAKNLAEKSIENKSDVLNLAKETLQIDEEGGELYFPIDLGRNKEISVRATQNNQDLIIIYNKLNTARSAIRLYDGKGTLLHKEEHVNIRIGKEYEVALNKLPAGVANLHVRLDNAVLIKQKILLQGAM